ncbi:MAG: hypothetical protein ACK533_11815 [Planctomycetota bacterium]
MPPASAELLAALDEGVGLLAADGGIVASNATMRGVLAAWGGTDAPAADLRGLAVAADDEARLRAGEAIEVARGGQQWRLRCRAADGANWLIVDETTAAHRAASAVAELARLRLLGRSAGALVHDFNNMLNAAIGLATTLRPLVVDPADAQLLQDMTVGTQRGAQLLRSVARMLARSPRERRRTKLASVVADAVALAGKALLQRGVEPTLMEVPEVEIHVDPTECVQAIWHGLAAVADASPRSLRVDAEVAMIARGDGRPRRCARVRLVAPVAEPAVAVGIARLLDGGGGLLGAIGSPGMSAGLAVTCSPQRRLGGDLIGDVVGDDFTLTYLWPALA